jgi:hypothetical protein
VENTIDDSQTHDRLRSTTVSAGVSRSLPGTWAVEFSGLFSHQTDHQLALPAAACTTLNRAACCLAIRRTIESRRHSGFKWSNWMT